MFSKDKYPQIFSKPCEVSVGEGWYGILDSLCGNIQGYLNNVSDRRDWTTKHNIELEEAKSNNWEDWPEYWSRDPVEVPEIVDQVVALQVKEKFGGLRFYYGGGDHYVSGLVSMAESMSYKTCEECGAPGELDTSRSWVRTVCEKHRL